MTIRKEQADDAGRIREMTELAFRTCPHACGREQDIVDDLRRAGALSLSLVAVDAGEVVGHVALSPVTIPDARGAWFGLGPISVLPRLQRTGIGGALMKAALAWLRDEEAAGCVLVGDPQYYVRFGFTSDPSLTVPGIPPEVTLAIRLRPGEDRGLIRFHPAFGC